MCHGSFFLFADDIKLAYYVELSSLPQTVANIKEDLNLPDDRYGQQATKFSAIDGVFLACECHTASG